MDLFVTVYQYICFPLYGIPRVRRKDYFVYDRAYLGYLNIIEKKLTVAIALMATD